ncbi:hypothetical protein M0R45_019293 [Rubus argutus]|uniref:SAC domain-containing protein n=1 Tax=Rubus argutus TaxID=59490 RepID=A0AAW1X8I9_RUBAR
MAFDQTTVASAQPSAASPPPQPNHLSPLTSRLLSSFTLEAYSLSLVSALSNPLAAVDWPTRSIETEQIIHLNGFLIIAKFLVTGSIPLRWDQIVDLTYKPKFEIVRLEEAVS